MGNETAIAQEEFTLSHVCNAPRELVWKAWTEPERLAQWWGPAGFAMLSCKPDLRPGGVFHYGMQAPNGGEMWGKWVFREIRAPERLTFVISFSDKDGGITRHPMAPTWPAEMLGTSTFEARGGKTLLTTRTVALDPTPAERATFEAGFEGMKQGFGGTWDQLAAHLAKG